MNPLLRVSACGVVLFGAVLFVSCVLVPWLGGPSLIPTDLHELCQQLLEESTRHEELNERSRSAVDLLDGKRLVTADVIAGRTSLVEAVTQFHALEAEARTEVSAAKTSDEAQARHVIGWVSEATRNDPRRGAVLRRLREEFRRAYPRARLEGRTEASR